MLFLKQTGGELDMKHTTTFTNLLNQNLGANYECVKSQLESMVKSVQPSIAQVNNNQALALFSSSTEYSWAGKRMTIDETLLGYSLGTNGETMQVLGVPAGSIDCEDISLFSENQYDYYAVSVSLIQNSYNFLVNNNMLFSTIDPISWHIPNFYFTCRDLAFALPKISNYHSLDEQIGGNCNWASGNPPTFNATSNAFDLKLKYTCTLNSLKDNQLIMTFAVNALLSLVPQFDEIKSVKVVVAASTFTGSEFSPAPKYGNVSNEPLLNYFVGQAAKSLENNAVFGSGLIYLPPTVINPAW
jgi:hypothetical protein